MNIISILKRIITFIIFFGTIFGFAASFRINDVSINEGNSGTRTLDFTVSVYGPCQRNITYSVDYTTSNGTATSPSDYISRTGTVSYSRSSTRNSGECGTRTIRITINGDTTYEPNETFNVVLSNPRSSNSSYPASISDNTGIGTINNDDSSAVVSAFNLRYKKNIKGNMKVIGNTILARKDSGGNYLSGTSSTNSGDQLRYVDVDGDSSTFNSSVAVFSDSAIIPTAANPMPAKVKWAGLYWTGYLHTYDENDIDGSDEVSVKANTHYKTLTDFASIDNVIRNHTVKFNIGTTSHDITTHTVLGEIQYTGSSSYTGWSYGCFAEVTSLMLDSDPRGNYSLANIPSMEGATNRDDYNDGLGNSGAWTLVVIYENNSVGEKTRNATVFDGFVKVSASTDAVINVSGFKTPKSGNVDSTLSVFASEGDRYLKGDNFKIESTDGDKMGASATLRNSSNVVDNFFDSSITGVDDRTPSIANNNGIDIHTDQVGTSGYNVIGTNQTKAKITLDSDVDVYYPVMVGFATELYMPKLCYDYSALLNGELMQKDANDRTFIPHKNYGTLQSKVFIRSLEGDFPYVRSTLKSSWRDITTPPSSSPPIISFDNALVQNPDVYAYEEPEYIDDVSGEYYVGTDRSTSGGQKGTIDPFKSLYAISNFEADRLYGSYLQLNVNVKASLALDENDTDSLTDYEFSTSDGTLEVCPGILTYNPMWYQFNVENMASTESNPNYSLGTQITGMPYDLQVVAYTKDGGGDYTVRTPFTGAIEVEPFEIPSFQSLGGYDENKYNFDRICEDSSNGKAWSNSQRHFTYFGNSKTTPLGITANDNKYAMRNAGIRMWVLMADYNASEKLQDITQNNNCVNTSGTCFKNLYASDPYYKTIDTCDLQCSGGSTDEECYQCLRAHYSQPICSRDNFSVRPYAVELNATNVNNSGTEVIMSKNDSTVKNINLISGDYDYTSSYKPISAPASGVETEGYYFRLLTNVREVVNNALSTLDEFFGLEFSADIDDLSMCRDTNHSKLSYKPDNPSISPWKIYHDNVGNYSLELFDRNWTMVDQARFIYKTTFAYNGNARTDDCTPDSAATSGVSGPGCNVQSYGIDVYEKIPVRMVPYKIDVSSSGANVALSSSPNSANSWVYMNDLRLNRDMAVKIAGTLRAITKDNKVTSNFTQGCQATDVNLSMDYNSTDFNASRTKSIAVVNLDSHDTALTGPSMVIDRNAEGNTTVYDLNNTTKLLISSSAFKYENNGTMPIDMRFTITKIWDKVADPVKVFFKKLSSLADRYKAWFNGVENSYTPNDKKDYNEYRTFLYGRVYTPIETLGAKVTKDSKDVTFSVLAYVSDPAKATQLLSIFDANNDDTTTIEEGLWYRVEAHSINAMDGQIVDLTDLNGRATITPNSNILFDKGSGLSGTVNIAYPKGGGRDRPYTALVEVNPDIWLKYHPTKGNGNPEFSIRFEDLGYNWAGKGKTGNVIKQTISPNSRYKVNW